MNNYENDTLQIPVYNIKSIIETIFGEYALDGKEKIAEAAFRYATVDSHKIMTHVNVYEISRCYGGPEEGGWYYDHYEIIESVPLNVHFKESYSDGVFGTDNVYAWQKAQQITTELETKYKDYSPHISVYIEHNENASQTIGTPHYC